MPATAAHACDPSRREADPAGALEDSVERRAEAIYRHRPTTRQRRFGLELEHRLETLQLAGSLSLDREVCQPLGSIGIAAANGELGQDRVGEELEDGAALELVSRDALGLVPFACP